MAFFDSLCARWFVAFIFSITAFILDKNTWNQRVNAGVCMSVCRDHDHIKLQIIHVIAWIV